MSLPSLFLRRALARSSSAFLRRSSPLLAPSLRRIPVSLVQSQSFISSRHLSNRRFDYDNDSKIGPDEILFEGCDYNHWLITMDFPTDPAPTREEMIETYIQTLAKVVGSVEEAKKRMYALSTTTYKGFQAVMTEEMSKKFEGLPGVVFILPDSYIDPVNKEYGGDKYENGVITPRPPPVQTTRRPRPRFDNRNDRPYNRPPQGNMSPDQQGMMQGDGRSYAPQQNYSPQMQDGGRGFGPGDNRGPVPPNQRAFQENHGNFAPRNHRNFGQENQGNFAPQDNRNFDHGPRGDNFRAPPGYGNDRQGPDSGYGTGNRQPQAPGYGNQYGQEGNPTYAGENRQAEGHGQGNSYSQGQHHDYAQGSGQGNNYSQGQHPNYAQGSGQGNSYSQGQHPNYAPHNYSSPPHGQPGPVPGQTGPPPEHPGSWQGRQ